jgi:TP53 regulating kinase-like protein
VLERALSSTHPRSEPLLAEILRVYAEGDSGDGKAVQVLKRLDEVRARGRKRSMLG